MYDWIDYIQEFLHGILAKFDILELNILDDIKYSFGTTNRVVTAHELLEALILLIIIYLVVTKTYKFIIKFGKFVGGRFGL